MSDRIGSFALVRSADPLHLPTPFLPDLSIWRRSYAKRVRINDDDDATDDDDNDGRRRWSEKNLPGRSGAGREREEAYSPLSSGGRQAVAAAAASACQVRVDDIIIQCELTMGA